MTTNTAPAAPIAEEILGECLGDVDIDAARLDPAVAAELAILAADPGAYPIQRLGRAISGQTYFSQDVARVARELRAEVISRPRL